VPSRSLSWRGFGVDIRVPERVAHLVRSRRSTPAQPGRIVFRDPPTQPTVRVRDLASALRFRDVAIARGREHAENQGWTEEGELADLIRSESWYHTIELPGGLTTPGQFDHRGLLSRYGFPADLTGQRALDVATFNGFWAFEMEKRGAAVTAIDLDDPREWDYPRPVRPIVAQKDETQQMSRGFESPRLASGADRHQRLRPEPRTIGFLRLRALR
jgi:hypothetical protein